MRRRSLLLPILAVTLVATVAAAVTTRTWRITTYKDFDEGESEGALLSSLGEVVAGFGTKRVEVSASQLFSSTVAPDGVVWLGAGDQPDLFAWDGKALKTVCRLDGVLVTALAAGSDGTIYAATLAGGPGAKLWRVTGGASGKCAEWVKLDGADQVWALLVEPGKGRLLAATGPNGKLLSIELASGKIKTLWESGQKHLMSITSGGAGDGSIGGSGGLYVGTSEEGILYRVEGDGSGARVVHDFAGDEVRAIVRSGDRLFVAVNEFEHSKGASAPAATIKPTGTRITPPAAAAAPATPQPPGRDRKGKGAVFRVDGDGRVEQLHSLSDGYFTALELDAQGNLFAAAGANGRVYLIRPDRTVLTAFTLPERQVLTLALGGAHPCLGTGDSGALYAIDREPPKGARWISKVLDAGYPARWGAVRWSATGSVTVETRAGNTAKPDKTWSEWQGLSGGAASPNQSGEGKVRSPGGRYLQVRATLGKEARLLDVAAWYLPQNQRARLTEITIGEDTASGVARALKIAGKPRSPLVKIRWKVDSSDDDDLVYRVGYRQEGEANWRPLGGPDATNAPLTAKDLEWNTESIPDGKYLVRVVASDERANPRDEALDHELVSPPVLVDNRKPEVTLKAAPPLVSGSARDSFSPIAELAWSLDGGDYQVLGPRDRLFDDLTEEFSIKLPDNLPAGAHSITVRALDAADNVGLGQVSFQIGK